MFKKLAMNKEMQISFWIQRGEKWKKHNFHVRNGNCQPVIFPSSSNFHDKKKKEISFKKNN